MDGISGVGGIGGFYSRRGSGKCNGGGRKIGKERDRGS